MAKLEKKLRTDMRTVLDAIHNGIISGSVSASYEDGSDITVNGVRCAVRVYERFSIL